MAQTFVIQDLTASQIARVTNRHRIAMSKVVLGFARLDTRLSDWVVEAYGMRFDRAAMLISHMSIDNKIQRLIRLYEHEGQRLFVKALKARRKEMAEHYEIRNLICHSACLGTWSKDRDYILFSHLNYTPGDTENMWIEAIPIQIMDAASDWAEQESAAVMDVWKRMSSSNAAGKNIG